MAPHMQNETVTWCVFLVGRGIAPCVSEKGRKEWMFGVYSGLCLTGGSMRSRGAQGQLTVTDFCWWTTLKCVCVWVCVQVGVNVQLIQVITIYREAVKTQIAKWRMALYICMHVYVSTGEHMSSLSLSDFPVPSIECTIIIQHVLHMCKL